jgi:hypothetical protein
LTEIKDFLEHYVKPARGELRGDLPADDDAQAEEDAESEDDDELEDALDGMEMDDDARARRPKAKYMKMFVKVANRKQQDVFVDLADLQRVS